MTIKELQCYFLRVCVSAHSAFTWCTPNQCLHTVVGRHYLNGPHIQMWIQSALVSSESQTQTFDENHLFFYLN